MAVLEETVIEDFDIMVVAGEGKYWLSQILFDLSVEVGIPPPQFFGKRLYNDPRGVQKWKITTLISRRDEDHADYDVEFARDYTDFNCSVSVAMHCAMSHICHKYRTCITHRSVFCLFAERGLDGEVVDRQNQYLTPIRRYLMEREFAAVNMEITMRGRLRR